MVISGHYPGEAHRTDLNNCDQPVHQVVMDYQSRAKGGDGWLRYFVFKPSQNQIAAFTYSPKLDAFETDANSQFELDYDMDGASYSVIATGRTSHRDRSRAPRGPVWRRTPRYSGTRRSATERATTTGRFWSFTTAVPNAAPVAQNDAYNVDEDNGDPRVRAGRARQRHRRQRRCAQRGARERPAHGALDLNADGGFTYTAERQLQRTPTASPTRRPTARQSNVATVAIRSRRSTTRRARQATRSCR